MSPQTEFTTLSPPLHNSYVWIIIPDSAYVCAYGLLDTVSLSLTIRLLHAVRTESGGGSWSRTNIVYHEGTDLQSAAEHAISTMPP